MQPHSELTAAVLFVPGALPAGIRRAELVVMLLPGLPDPVREVVTGRLAEVLQAQLTEIDLGEAAVEAWSRIWELHAAAERTWADPAAREDVTLLDHEVVSEHHPTLAIWLDGQRVAELTLDLTFTLTFVGVVAVVRDGRLVGLRSGELTVSGRLGWRGRSLLEPPAVTLLAGAAVPLGSGVPLVRGATGAPRR